MGRTDALKKQSVITEYVTPEVLVGGPEGEQPTELTYLTLDSG